MRIRRTRALLLGVVLAVGAQLVPARAQLHPMRQYAIEDGKLITGEWAFDFAVVEEPMLVLADNGPITGFAFGPGTIGVAYCAPAGQEGGSGLWVVSALWPHPLHQDYPFTKTDSAPRLLWAAPAGVSLRGPVWWAPNGSQIAVLACRGEAADLVVVDYAAGQATWATDGATVIDAAWGRRAERLAYVADGPACREVWVQTLPPGQAQRVGQSGHRLRWSLDGSALKWLAAKSDSLWIEMTWDAATGRVSESDPQPPRPEGALWSPDGKLSASLAPGEDDGEEELMICHGPSALGESIRLSGGAVGRLLGWSPDSRVVMVLGPHSVPIAVSPQPISETVAPIAEMRQGYSQGRAVVAGLPIDPEAGPPSWAFGCDMIAYVVAEQSEEFSAAARAEHPHGCLVASLVRQEYLEPTTRDKEEARVAVSNMKNVALALQMYLADNNDIFPQTGDTLEVSWILDPYVHRRTVFMRPGTEDEMAIQYLVPPGLRLVEVSDPVGMPVAIVDYHPAFYVVAYGDGHVRMFEKHENYTERWEAWWRDFREERAQRNP